MPANSPRERAVPGQLSDMDLRLDVAVFDKTACNPAAHSTCSMAPTMPS